MYQCPECGTEYTVVPDVCVSCGHVPEENTAVDLLAAAAAHERKTAEQKREQLQQYAARKAEKDAAAMAESADVQETPDVPVSAEPVSLPPKTKKRSRKGLKSAAVCGAAAVALGGAAYFAPMFGKPAGFEKSSIGTFYMKDDALWFHNGLNGKAVCVNPELKIAQPVYDDLPEDIYISDDYALWIVKYLVHVSEDGKDLYYPKSFSLEEENCTLMHCTADHPEQAEEVAEIRFTELAYNQISDTIGTNAFYANSVLTAEQPRLEMNPAYLLCGDGLYYRDPDGQFCCLRNGQTEVIAPVVERFWTLPEHEGVYYITIADYDAFKERIGSAEPEFAFRPDYSCMTQTIPFQSDTDGSNVNIMLHSDDYALFRTKPGESPQRLIEEGIEDWKPFHETAPAYLYYTVFLKDERATELRRFRFDTESSETVSRMNDEGKIALLQDYPDGSCYFSHNSLSAEYAAQVIPNITDSMRRYAETEDADLTGVVVVQDENGNMLRLSFNSEIMANQVRVYYQQNGSEPKAIMEDAQIYRMTNTACESQPYIWLQQSDTGAYKRRLFFRSQEIEVTFDTEKYMPSPDSFAFSPDGTKLIAFVTDYTYSSSDGYGTPGNKIMEGTLNGAAPVSMKQIAAAKDEASVAAVELENQPAEIVRITKDGMFSGNQKIASDIYMKDGGYQPEYRQLCFIADETNLRNAAENVIVMNPNYCGTLMRRADRKTDVIAEGVTGFIPVDREHFAVICGEPGAAGTFNLCTPHGYYQADTGVTRLCCVQEIGSSGGLLNRLLP